MDIQHCLAQGGFHTQRLSVSLLPPAYEMEADKPLIDEIAGVLTAPVLASLPEPLAVPDAPDPVARWVAARQHESHLCQVRDRQNHILLGLLIIAESVEPEPGATLRLGYLFAEHAWGRGYATELLKGLIVRFRHCRWRGRLLAGVSRGNSASVKVLIKAGFVEAPELSDQRTAFFSSTTN